ncbi:related to multidrug resistant protein [Rhynchosporium graminicola]|uniref:Related to multidrug resistant protein n=1 Tax=Rhynchosporium graminicola TaxID=2792576 RepID=A0A1E1KFT3_9HELO|nr:related to multidrug resistant protein [Rhynchosporium commune]
MTLSPHDPIEMADVTELAPSPHTVPVTKQDDPYLVAFALPYDTDNPLDWSTGHKWTVTDVLSAIGFNRIMVSTIMAPALSTIAKDLDMTVTESALALSIYLIAIAFGPLLIGPLSEFYGRSIVLHASGILFLVWNLACGFANTKELLIGARFLAGFGASPIYALAGGVLSNVRSLAGIWQNVQPGGGCSGRRQFSRLLDYCHIHDLQANLWSTDPPSTSRTTSPSSAHVHVHFRLLAFHPVIQITALLERFNYSLLYIVLSISSTLWIKHYGQSVEISGLHYIALSLGEVFGSQICGFFVDFFYRRQRALHPHLVESPEVRLPLMVLGLVMGYIFLLFYGWTAENRVFWVAVDIGIFLSPMGIQTVSMISTAYIIDSYARRRDFPTRQTLGAYQ